jgi:hypothetical protein
VVILAIKASSSAAASRQARAILEQRPAHALQGTVSALLDAAHLVDGEAGVPDDVELVEGNPSVGQVLLAALDERRRHVDAHRADLVWGATAAGQLGGQRLNGLDTAAFGHCHHPALHGVSRQGDVVMPARPRRFVDRQLVHRGQGVLRQRQLDVAFADRGHAVAAVAHQPSRGGEGHLLAEHQHQRLEQQGEAQKSDAGGAWILCRGPDALRRPPQSRSEYRERSPRESSASGLVH